MSQIGRNAPCPCGSGKKYKSCCLPPPAPSMRFTREERASALQRLDRFLEGPGWEAMEAEAEEVFWGDLADRQDELEAAGFGDGHFGMMEQVFDAWFSFDFRIERNVRPVDRFLASGASLTSGERAYLEMARGTTLGLYEVVEVRRGDGLTLKDLVGGGHVSVQERTASRSLARWDLLVARVFPRGASGRPELDGGVLHFTDTRRTGILQAVREELDDLLQAGPEDGELGAREMLPPFVAQMWAGQALQIPTLTTTDGEEMVFCTATHTVRDPDAAARALDAHPDLEAEDPPGRWVWVPGAGQGGESVHGNFALDGSSLTLETMARGRVERGRALLHELLGDDLTDGLVKYRDVAQAIAERRAQGPVEPYQPTAEERALLLDFMERHYRDWVDQPVPMLDGLTPREAAGRDATRERAASAIKDLENQYEHALRSGQPAYDPTWMWADLGLGEHAAAPRRWQEPPRTGLEATDAAVPGLRDAAVAIADRHRGLPAFGTNSVITREDLAADLVFGRFLRQVAERTLLVTGDSELAQVEGRLIASHLEYASNFELHLRKTFWVDDSLAWMLGQTRLDISGSELRPPFATFACVFTDRSTLGIAERMVAGDEGAELRGRILHILTVYVTQLPPEQEGGSRGLRLSFTADALGPEQPYLAVRDLPVQDDASLEDVIRAHFPEVQEAGVDPFFTSPEMRALVHRVLNVMLYATSAGITPVERGGQRPAARRPLAGRPADAYSSDSVYFLPGFIDITELQRLRAVERSPSGGELLHRFMVRGHWRRASANWKDPAPRWIRPYWKGPDMAATIERAYRLKGPEPPDGAS